MSTQPFLYPHLTGARFEGHAIPLEFLKDLAALEEMIVAFAKAEFLKDHPDRQRVPSGFAKGIELKLTGMEEGSAVPVISLDIGPDPELSRQVQTYSDRHDAIIYFERAREALVAVIRAAEQSQSLTDYLPEKTLRYFGKFGRSLRDDEAVEFTTPTRDSPARLTKKAWLWLVQVSSEGDRLIEETSIRGIVPEADQDHMTFEVQPIVGQKVQAPIPPQHLDTILEALRGYKNGARVLLQGIGPIYPRRALTWLRFNQGREPPRSIGHCYPSGGITVVEGRLARRRRTGTVSQRIGLAFTVFQTALSRRPALALSFSYRRGMGSGGRGHSVRKKSRWKSNSVVVPVNGIHSTWRRMKCPSEH